MTPAKVGRHLGAVRDQLFTAMYHVGVAAARYDRIGPVLPLLEAHEAARVVEDAYAQVRPARVALQQLEARLGVLGGS